MRFWLSVFVILLLSSSIVYAQFDDNDESLFESESTVDDPTDDQLDIPLEGDADSGLKDVETEQVTEQTLCCQMSESERAADELCVNIVCP